jgi:hypothetical protein
MKRFHVSANVLVIFSLMVSGAGFSQTEFPNEVGIYLNEEGTGPTGVYTNVLEAVDVYVVLLRPTDVDAPGGGEPLEWVQSFEFMLHFDNPAPLVVTTIILPGGALNIGDAYNFNLGYLEFIVGVPNPRPVVDEAISLVGIRFLPIEIGVTEVRMGPTSVPTVPGEMLFLDPDDHQIMYPISGSQEDPVFIFNGEAVPVENQSFGSVKALFR